MAGRWELTEEQWKLEERVLQPGSAAVRRGRPWQDARGVLNGVLWVLGTRVQWRELPEKYPPYQSCHCRFQQWICDGKLIEAPRLLARPLMSRAVEPGRGVCGCNLRERQEGGFAIGSTRRGKGTKIVAIAAGNSLPLAVSVQSASPVECQLVEEVLAGSSLDELPARLIGNKDYESDGLDRKMDEEYGSEMIATTAATAPRRRIDYRSEDTKDDVRWNGSSPGCTTSKGS